MALARVIAEHKSIHRYWALYNADPSGAAINSLEVIASVLRSNCNYYHMLFLPRGKVHLQASCMYRLPISYALLNSPYPSKTQPKNRNSQM
jgi:hypothetical protein